MGIRDSSITSFPAQKLTLSQKDTKWKEACVDAVIGREGASMEEKNRMKTAYDLYNGIFNEKDLMYVTDPYKVNDSFPASLQNFNIIRPKVNLLLGEESKRPQNVVVYQTNEESISQLQEKMKEMLSEVVIEELVNSIEPPQEGAPNAEEQQNKLDKKIGKIIDYVTSEYNSPAEVTAQSTIAYLKRKLNLETQMIKGFKDGLCGGKEIHYVGIRNGDPFTERVNPLECAHDSDPDLDNIEDGDWFVRHMLMTPAAIYDRFNDIMEESDLDKILANIEGRGGTSKQPDYTRIDYKVINHSLTDKNNLQETHLDIWHVVWRSFKKIGFVTSWDEEGNSSTDMVDESYVKADENEEITWDWITEIWEGYKIGTDIYVGIQPLSYQNTSIDNPFMAKLPYIGSMYSDTNSVNRSLVDIMKPLAYMYIIVWYRLELALSRDKGKIINMDITQIPKSMGIDFNKWAHYLSAIGVNLINPYEEGWDIPGREGGRPSGFNQMSSQDLTMTDVIAQYVQLMDKIEDMVGELSGVSKARQGQVHQSELVGNVERKIIQSSHITEVLFLTHNDIKRRVYTMLIDVAKHAWRNSEKKHLYYVLDDMSRKFIDLSEEFLYSDFDVFLGDSTKEMQDIEALKSLLQAGMQNGATLLDAASILTSENMNDIKKRLEVVEKRREEMQRQEQESQQQMEQMRSETQMQIMETEVGLRQEELRIKEEDSIRKAETALLIAQMKASEGGVEVVEDDSYKEELERDKLELQERKVSLDYSIKQKQLGETIRQGKVAEDLKRQELKIRAKQANKKPAATKSK